MKGDMGHTGGLIKPLPLAQKMPGRLFKCLWASLVLKEGALSRKTNVLDRGNISFLVSSAVQYIETRRWIISWAENENLKEAA